MILIGAAYRCVVTLGSVLGAQTRAHWPSRNANFRLAGLLRVDTTSKDLGGVPLKAAYVSARRPKRRTLISRITTYSKNVKFRVVLYQGGGGAIVRFLETFDGRPKTYRTRLPNGITRVFPACAPLDVAAAYWVPLASLAPIRCRAIVPCCRFSGGWCGGFVILLRLARALVL